MSSLSGFVRGDISALEVEKDGAEEYKDEDVEVDDDDDVNRGEEEETMTVEELIEGGFDMAAWALAIVL